MLTLLPRRMPIGLWSLAFLGCCSGGGAPRATVVAAFATGVPSSTTSSPSSHQVCNNEAERSPPPFSGIGYGSYRIGSRDPEQGESVRAAIRGGITLIDTSANYGDGEAEETIGRVIAEGLVPREKLTIVSKFGYIQGQNLERYNQGEVVTPDTVHVASYIKHCIHPDFMRDQLDRSLQRLNQPYLDRYLLHNPEYYITHGVKEQGEVAPHREEMTRRIYEAFLALEQEVQVTGRIKSYGISSNSFSLPEDHIHFFPYQGLLDLAAKAAAQVSPTAKHSFTTIQLPANLFEQVGLQHAVPWAHSHGLEVLINRPLNAFTDQRSARLADYPDHSGWLAESFEAARGYAAGKGWEGMVAVLDDMEREKAGVDSLFTYEAIAGRRFVPALQREIDNLNGACDDQCVRNLREYLSASEVHMKHVVGRKTRALLLAEGHDIPADQSLQEYAMRWLLGHKGVTCVLLGSRRVDYVKDALPLL